MTRISGEVTIDAPVAEVFDLVADERNEPAYNPRIAHAEMVDEEPVGVGSRFLVQPRGTGPRGAMSMRVVEHDRPHRLHSVISSSYLHVDGTLSFDEVDGGTRLRWDWDMSLVGPMRALSPVLSLVGPRWERRNWVGLQQYVESGRRPT